MFAKNLLVLGLLAVVSVHAVVLAPCDIAHTHPLVEVPSWAPYDPPAEYDIAGGCAKITVMCDVFQVLTGFSWLVVEDVGGCAADINSVEIMAASPDPPNMAMVDESQPGQTFPGCPQAGHEDNELRCDRPGTLAGNFKVTYFIIGIGPVTVKWKVGEDASVERHCQDVKLSPDCTLDLCLTCQTAGTVIPILPEELGEFCYTHYCECYGPQDGHAICCPGNTFYNPNTGECEACGPYWGFCAGRAIPHPGFSPPASGTPGTVPTTPGTGPAGPPGPVIVPYCAKGNLICDENGQTTELCELPIPFWNPATQACSNAVDIVLQDACCRTDWPCDDNARCPGEDPNGPGTLAPGGQECVGGRCTPNNYGGV